MDGYQSSVGDLRVSAEMLVDDFADEAAKSVDLRAQRPAFERVGDGVAGYPSLAVATGQRQRLRFSLVEGVRP